MAKAKRQKEAPPPAQIQSLLRQLGKGEWPSAIVLRGEERYFVDHAITGIIAAAAKRELEVVRYDTADPDFQASDLCSDLIGGALFASARLFVIRGADALLKKNAGAAAASFAPAVLARAQSGDGGGIVLYGAGLRANQSLIKSLQELGAPTIACRKLWDSPPPWDPDPRKAELVQWLVQRARERRISLSPDQAAFVVAATGNDLPALDGQLDRLAQGGGDVRSEVTWQGAVSPFQLAEPILAGDAARAIAGLESLFQGGFQGRDGARTLDRGALLALLFSALGSKLREVVAAGEVLARRGAAADALEAAGVKGTPTAKKTFEARLRLRPHEEWSRMYEELCALEKRSRTGADVDAVDFARLILRWRRRAPARR